MQCCHNANRQHAALAYRQGAGSEETDRKSWGSRRALDRSAIKGRQGVCLLRMDPQGEYEGGVCIELGFSVPEKETYMSVSVSISMYVWKLIIETDSCSYGG